MPFVRGPLRPGDLLTIVVAVPTALLMVLLAAKDGGFGATVWLPAGIFFSLLLAIRLAFAPIGFRRSELVAIAALACFALWSGLSIVWAQVRGDAWDGAERTLMYAAVFSLFVLLPWRAATAALFVAMFAVGVTAVTVIQFLRAAASPAAHHDFFISGRLAEPISYSNGACGLLLMAAFPAMILGSRREATVLVRGILLATAGAALELAITCQSRASLVAVPLTALFVAIVTPRRLRLLVVVVPVVVVVALAARPMLGVYDGVLSGPGAHALARARTSLLASIVALFVVGVAIGVVDRVVRVPARVIRGTGVLVALVLVLAAVGGAVALVRLVPHPVREVHDRWTSFAHSTGYTDRRKAHLLSTGTNRYDIWRVALDEFRSNPVVGIGSDNFAADYLQHRRSAESPLYPHSILLRVISQTGIVGTLLFVAWLGAACFAAFRPSRRGARSGTLAAGAAAVFVYWIVHGSVDWFWEIPALGAPALACLGIAVRLGGGERRDEPGRGVPRYAVLAVAILVVASFGFPWVAAQETAVAAANWPADRANAYRRLDLAARLNPLSDLPAVTKGLVAARSGDPAEGRRAFDAATRRNDRNWFAELELGVMEAKLGDRSAARAALRRAAVLDPREPTVAVVSRRVTAGLPVTQDLVDRLVGAVQPTGSGR